MHRSLGPGLYHPGSVIPWLDLSLGDPVGEFPLQCGRGQLRTGPAGRRGTLGPALRHSASQQHDVLPKAAPAVREAVITQVGGGARATCIPLPEATAFGHLPPPTTACHKPLALGGQSCVYPMCGCTVRKRLTGTTLRRV